MPQGRGLAQCRGDQGAPTVAAIGGGELDAVLIGLKGSLGDAKYTQVRVAALAALLALVGRKDAAPLLLLPHKESCTALALGAIDDKDADAQRMARTAHGVLAAW